MYFLFRELHFMKNRYRNELYINDTKIHKVYRKDESVEGILRFTYSQTESLITLMCTYTFR